jgi:hypothetical protein
VDVKEQAPRAQWLECFVTRDKLCCVYIAENAAAVHEHADCGGFPADVINEVVTVIGPVTGE